MVDGLASCLRAMASTLVANYIRHLSSFHVSLFLTAMASNLRVMALNLVALPARQVMDCSLVLGALQFWRPAAWVSNGTLSPEGFGPQRETSP